MSWLFVVVACTCPAGFERRGTACVAGGGPAVDPGPPDEDTFRRRFEDAVCDALVDCFCDALDVDTGTCDPDLDCPSVSWPEGCRYDPLAGEACLSGRFACDDGAEVLSVEPPEVCATVYVCGGTTPSTGSTGDTGAR